MKTGATVVDEPGTVLNGMLQISGAASRSVPVEVVREFYFEEGELFLPPNFRATAEERKSGFQ